MPCPLGWTNDPRLLGEGMSASGDVVAVCVAFNTSGEIDLNEMQELPPMPDVGTNNAVSTTHFLFRLECRISENHLIVNPSGSRRMIICGTRATAIRYHRQTLMRPAHVTSQVFSKSFIGFFLIMFSNITALTVSYCAIIVPHPLSGLVGRIRRRRILMHFQTKIVFQASEHCFLVGRPAMS